MAALSPSALALLQVLSLLDNDKIPQSILFKYADNVTLPNYPQSQEACCSAIAELSLHALITMGPILGEIQIHPLVQDAVREQFSNEEKSAVFEAAVHLLRNPAEFIELDLNNHEQELAQLFRHMLKLVEISGACTISGKFEPSTRSAIADMLIHMAWY